MSDHERGAEIDAFLARLRWLAVFHKVPTDRIEVALPFDDWRALGTVVNGMTMPCREKPSLTDVKWYGIRLKIEHDASA